MFRNNYQGGAVVEVFSGQGKDPVAKWKLSGGPSAISKEYNKEVKGFVYCLEGSSQTVKMQMPQNGKMSLGLLQRFLVLQVNIPQCKDFSVELVITDSEHLKRRLHLSTVHKELSTTLLHAKIPLVGLKRNIWSTLCFDLVSFSGELFKGFLTLDGITLFATCKVRRIFTMKTEPTGMSDDDMFLSGSGLTDLIPRSYQFPPDVNHITQVLNMENLLKAVTRTGSFKSDCAHDQSGPARSTSFRQTVPEGVLQTASGSRASGPRPQPGRKSSAASDLMDRNVIFISHTEIEFVLNRGTQKMSLESIAQRSENVPHGEPNLTVHGVLYVATPERLQPHPPADQQASRKPQVVSAGRKTSSAHLDAAVGHRRETSKIRERSTPSSGREGRQQPLILTEKIKHLTADEVRAAKEISGVALNPAECPACSSHPGLPHDLQVWSSWESNEGSEPQLSLQEGVFIFSSQPHSPKRGQGQGDQEKIEIGADWVQSRSERRHEVQPEDDFLGSESDEGEDNNKLKPVDSSHYNLPLLGSLKMHGDDDEELRMLASLKREQEEDECKGSGLSASQIHQCDVSISMSSDDTSTWTHISMPANQGHHYQNEINPLLHSNPREWMDVLSPPIMPPSQQRRSANTRNNRENQVGGEEEPVNEEGNDEEYLNLFYDPCLKCYFDPQTGKYYELA
ncbi:protein CFAP20DC [Echeneis naucrates]|uniref:protein CFAP20DC n=1 Tax=Echeneis naucrates TaxID=173247 RepID=UPI0011137FEB|nr:uncharacterized protein C3orf67 homolog [Echeneis naucrates]